MNSPSITDNLDPEVSSVIPSVVHQSQMHLLMAKAKAEMLMLSNQERIDLLREIEVKFKLSTGLLDCGDSGKEPNFVTPTRYKEFFDFDKMPLETMEVFDTFIFKEPRSDDALNYFKVNLSRISKKIGRKFSVKRKSGMVEVRRTE